MSLANKHVLTERELAKVMRLIKGRINTDKEIIDSLKKERLLLEEVKG